MRAKSVLQWWRPVKLAGGRSVGQLAILDWLAIGLYFALIFGVAWWVAGRKKATHESSAGYFLAGRNVGWFVVGAALFASNIGSEHLVWLYFRG